MTNELESNLKQEFGWHKLRIQCLVQIVLGLIAVRSVNLKEVACAIASDSHTDSNYRRLQRFFAEVEFPRHVLAQLISGLLFLPTEGLYLSMDRTNWQWGKSNINILVLSACYKGAAIPLYWIALDKKGNSDTKERIRLINFFIKGFGREKILYLLGDREFIGEDWFGYLIKKEIPFDLRVKSNHVTTNSKGLAVDIDGLFHHLKVGELEVLKGKRKLMKQVVYLSALRLEDGDLLILASSSEPELALDRYAFRWEIETLFSCLKGRGFRFESTRITKLKRVEKMVSVLAIAFAWSHKVGDWRAEVKPIKIKKHGRLAVSYFRYGLDWIRRGLVGIKPKRSQFEESLKILMDCWPNIDHSNTFSNLCTN